MLTTVLLVILILALVGGMPGFGFHRYGWGPSGLAAIVLILLIVLILSGSVEVPWYGYR